MLRFRLRPLGILVAALACILLATLAAFASTPPLHAQGDSLPAPSHATAVLTDTVFLPWVGSGAHLPLDVIARLDAGRAVAKAIPPSGGSITATGADGDSFTLTIPDGALFVTTTVTLTPVTALAGAPYPLAAAVQIGPDMQGLRQAATLRIVPATAVPVPREVTFAWYSSGQDFHLYPVSLDITKLEFAVTRLHGYGVGRVPAAGAAQAAGVLADPAPVWTPAGNLARLVQELQQLIKADRTRQIQGEEPTAEFTKKMLTALREYHKVQIAPFLKAMETDCFLYEFGFPNVQGWGKQVQISGLADAFAAELEAIHETHHKAAVNCYKKAALPCMDWSDAVQEQLVTGYHREVTFLGAADEVPQPWDLPSCAVDVVLASGLFDHALEPSKSSGWLRSFWFAFPDDTVSSVGFYFPPSMEQYARARMQVDGVWRDLPLFPAHNFYCRDRADERMSDFVITLVAPATYTETIRPRLIADNVGCWRWEGTNYLQEWGRTYSTEIHVVKETDRFDSTGALFERPEAQRNIQAFTFNPTTGALTVPRTAYAPVPSLGHFSTLYQKEVNAIHTADWCTGEMRADNVLMTGPMLGNGILMPNALPNGAFQYRNLEGIASQTDVPIQITEAGTLQCIFAERKNVPFFSASGSVNASGKSASGQRTGLWNGQPGSHITTTWSMIALRQP